MHEASIHITKQPHTVRLVYGATHRLNTPMLAMNEHDIDVVLHIVLAHKVTPTHKPRRCFSTFPDRAKMSRLTQTATCLFRTGRMLPTFLSFFIEVSYRCYSRVPGEPLAGFTNRQQLQAHDAHREIISLYEDCTQLNCRCFRQCGPRIMAYIYQEHHQKRKL